MRHPPKKKMEKSVLTPLLLSGLAVLGVLVLFSLVPIVGKAGYGLRESTVDLQYEEETFTMLLSTGINSFDAMYWELSARGDLGATISLCDDTHPMAVEESLGGDFLWIGCREGQVIFGTALLGPGPYPAGEVELTLQPGVVLPKSFVAYLGPLDVRDQQTNDDLFPGEEIFSFPFGTPIVVAAAAPEPVLSSVPAEPAPSSSGGGSSLTCTREWSCSSWSSCGQAGRQMRSCHHNCPSSKTVGERVYPVIQLGPGEPVTSRSCTPDQLPAEVSDTFPAAPPEKLQQIQHPAPIPSSSLPFPGWYLLIAGGVVLVVGLLLGWRRWKGTGSNLSELQEWVTQEKKAGHTDDELRWELKGANWDEKEIDAALR